MNELRLSALRVQQMVMNLGNNQAQNNLAALESQLNAAVRVLQRRQIRIEDPVVRTQVANTVNTISRYIELLSLYRQDNDITTQLQILSQNNIEQFTRFSSEVQPVGGNHRPTQSKRTGASQTGQRARATLAAAIRWRVIMFADSYTLACGLSLSHTPSGTTNPGRCSVCWRGILTPHSRKPQAFVNWIQSGG